MQTFDKYHISYSPNPNSKLWKLAAAWFGHDAARSIPPKQTLTLGMPNNIHNTVISGAKLKGFGAIMYAPFSLKKGMTLIELDQFITTFCSTQQPFQTGLLQFTNHASQIFIEPIKTSAPLFALAANCVKFFDNFREIGKPITISDRMREIFNERQIENLVKWGNPYIFEDFQFRIQLTSPLNEKMIAQLGKLLPTKFTPLIANGLTIDNLGLFGRNNDDTSPTLIKSFEFKKVVQPAPTEVKTPVYDMI